MTAPIVVNAEPILHAEAQEVARTFGIRFTPEQDGDSLRWRACLTRGPVTISFVTVSERLDTDARP